MARRKIAYMNLAELESAPVNPKNHASALIEKSIDRFGLVEVITLDERTGKIISGHGRRDELLDRKARGDAPPADVTVKGDDWLVPVSRGWASADDAEALAAGIALNQVGTVGGWKLEELAPALQELADLDFGFDGVGFEPSNIDDMLATLDAARIAELPKVADDAVPAVPKKPITKRGDLIVLGDHRLLCGDSRDPASFARLLGEERADMVWTDPPYGVAVNVVKDVEEARKRHRRTDGKVIENDQLDEVALGELVGAALKLSAAACRPGSCWFVAAPAGPLFDIFSGVLSDLGVWRQTLVWLKDRFAFGRSDYHYRHEAILYGWTPGAAHTEPPDRTQDSVWEIPRPSASEEHPTMKPVELVARAVRNHTKPDAVVLDPFAGSGTTMMACEQEGRQARCIELDPGYCDVIAARWRAHTGIDPIREKALD